MRGSQRKCAGCGKRSHVAVCAACRPKLEAQARVVAHLTELADAWRAEMKRGTQALVLVDTDLLHDALDLARIVRGMR